MKVPSGFSSNIKGIINMAEKNFQNLKAHDCHVIMTQLLPVALRGLLPNNVRVPIVKLCAFLNAISQKVINPLTLKDLEKDVVQCLVSFELLFPPSFFNIMTHLIVHLVEEIGQKEACPRGMEQRRSLNFVLTLFLILSRLVFLNRAMRGDCVEKAR